MTLSDEALSAMLKAREPIAPESGVQFTNLIPEEKSVFDDRKFVENLQLQRSQNKGAEWIR